MRQNSINKFSNVRSLTLFFEENFGDDTTVVTYIGLSGEWSPLVKDPVIALYEAAPNPADHQVETELTNLNRMGL